MSAAVEAQRFGMPKYHKKRRGFYPYNALANPINMMLGMTPLPPNPFAVPQFQFSTAPSQSPNVTAAAIVPRPASEPEPEPLSKAERACLPFFKDELSRTQPREPTDIVIIDFDRTLLGTPSVNPDFVGKESRLVLEHGLGAGHCWQQSRVVLEAAISRGQWDEDLTEIAKAASESELVVLVITTSRQMSEINLIEDALESRGISSVDHFACTYSNGTEEDEDEAEQDADPDSNVVLDAWAKQVMVELLLESYETLERIAIFDSNRRDRTKFKKVISQFVRDGWLNAEAFQIPDVIPKRTQLENVQDQRQLIENVVNAAASPLVKSVVVIEWSHKLTGEARLKLAHSLVNLLGEGLLDRLFLEDISIVKGSLPSDMRALAAQQGQTWHWAVSGFKIENRILWLKVHSKTGSGSNYLKTARLARGVEDAEVNFADTALPLTPPTSTPATTSSTELPSLADLALLRLETFVYEHRELHLQKRRL